LQKRFFFKETTFPQIEKKGKIQKLIQALRDRQSVVCKAFEVVIDKICLKTTSN